MFTLTVRHFALDDFVGSHVKATLVNCKQVQTDWSAIHASVLWILPHLHAPGFSNKNAFLKLRHKLQQKIVNGKIMRQASQQREMMSWWQQ